MATPRKRETLSDQILQQVDSPDRSLMLIKDTPSSTPLSFTGDVPFWSVDLRELATPDRTDPAAEPLLLATLERMRFVMSRRTAPMPFTRRRIDADEIHFIHRGCGRLLTETGEIEAPAGRFILIARGISYRVLPETDDFIDLILESEAPLAFNEQCAVADLPFIKPSLPIASEDGIDRRTWDERLVSANWTANAVRDYDPVRSAKIVGENKMVMAVDVGDIPASSPTSPMPGLPFGLVTSPVLSLEVSKRTDPLPFYHRNNRRNEFEFVHQGGGDQDTELGYVLAPPGTLYNLPKGIEHSPMNRTAPLACLIMETDGDVFVNPDILAR